MIGQNISFIVGQHHSELDQAIWHHRGRNGFVLDVAAIVRACSLSMTYSTAACDRIVGKQARHSPVFRRLAWKGPGARKSGETPDSQTVVSSASPLGAQPAWSQQNRRRTGWNFGLGRRQAFRRASAMSWLPKRCRTWAPARSKGGVEVSITFRTDANIRAFVNLIWPLLML